jgi:hypothetical protein
VLRVRLVLQPLDLGVSVLDVRREPLADVGTGGRPKDQQLPLH